MNNLGNSLELVTYRDAQAHFLANSSPTLSFSSELADIISSRSMVATTRDILSSVDNSSTIAIPDYVTSRLNLATPEEFDLFQNTLGFFLRIALSLGLPPVFPWHDIVDGLLTRRALLALNSAGGHALSTLEFGNTTGCSSTLLALSEMSTYSVPFAESLHSLQSLLFSTLPSNSRKITPPILLPWWEWLSHDELQVDVVIGNSWLSSLPPLTQKGLLTRLRDILARGDAGLLLFYLRPGEEFLSWRGFWEVLNSLGFTIVHFDSAFCIFSSRCAEPYATRMVQQLSHTTQPNSLDLLVPSEHFEWLRLVLEEGR